MKRIVLISVFSVLFLGLFADDFDTNKNKEKRKDNKEMCIVHGKVIDKITGESLVGASISVEGIIQGINTDLDGRFIISGLEPGEYRINVRYISYKEETRVLSIDKKGNISISVELVAR